MTSKLLLTLSLAALLSACGPKTDEAKPVETQVEAPEAETAEPAPEFDLGDQPQVPTVTAGSVEVRPELLAALSAQDENVKTRYQARHPGNTLAFFGIEPGMTVAEALPGGGWYTKILLNYLGPDGEVIGLDYDYDMWSNFGFMTEEAMKAKKTWAKTWTDDAQPWRGANGAAVSAATFSTVPQSRLGTVDAVLFIRALHNMARFEEQGQYLSNAAAQSYAMLKPGGIVGVVQHRAPESASDEWANGNNGYLKESFVIKTFKDAGFTLVARSEMNANSNDRPTEDDIVWRLPPTFGTTNPAETDTPEMAAQKIEMRAKMIAVGESDRMTLRFRKD
ncbi:class I SAM-dependent methyltransferase [Robiginitomaculum antarcticum]|uniref:class I SAM-dependent methyltransferase n=1 Tax=Robiginitomaculum antarcticum TaxID=437507 RepID=UPI000374E645|nr:class I SAM-dependent methyltransferase [Robiginitomaculum antarcticum]